MRTRSDVHPQPDEPLARLIASAERELRCAEVYSLFVANRLQLARLGHVSASARIGDLPSSALSNVQMAATDLTGRARELLSVLEPALVRNADVFADFARRRVDPLA